MNHFALLIALWFNPEILASDAMYKQVTESSHQ